MIRWALILCLLFSTGAFASYRVYELKVKYYKGKGKLDRVEKKSTTLDPTQYLSFHGLTQRATVELLDTWYCPGDTRRRDFCAKPKLKSVPKRGPASTEPKRGSLPYGRQPIIPR